MKEDKSFSSSEKQEILKQIIRELHAGVPVDKLQKTFAGLVKNTSPEEIADMENALIKEGFPPQEIQRLCDVHVQVFEKSLAKTGKARKIPGHPIHTFIEENKEAKKRLKKLGKALKQIKREQSLAGSEFASAWQDFRALEKHYQRKENQLFPALEAVHFTGPTQVMWGKHDEIRALMKEVGGALAAEDRNGLHKAFKSLDSAVKKMIFLEEKILYPTSARKLKETDWARIKQGEPEIGYAWIKPSGVYDADIARAAGAGSGDASAEISPSGPSEIFLAHGQLTVGQMNLMLKNLPVDITFVDENDTVRYYNDTAERIFPRSPGIIGRHVQNCHPPKSVRIVEDILRSFREKTKTSAEFWIQKDGLFILIRYFPVYDASGRYRGVIEVSQEVSGIRKLVGEKRILDW